MITTYRQIIRRLGAGHPTIRITMESILAKEAHHAEDLNDLLGNDASS